MSDDTESAPTRIGGMTEREWLSLVGSELQASIGFRHKGDIEEARIRSLKAYGGDTGIPNLDGRSSVNDTALADAVATVLPDLLEIYTGGEDVAAFKPVGPEDRELAEQETDTVVAIAMEENDGYGVAHDYCWNALLCKVGYIKVRVETRRETSTSHVPLDGLDPNALAAQIMEQHPDAEVLHDSELGVLEVSVEEERPHVVWEAVPSEDMAVGSDTVKIGDATYCVQRTRLRAQELIAKDFDRAKVTAMSDMVDEDGVSDARDTVEEDAGESSTSHHAGLAFVTLYEHYIRVADDKGVIRLWQVMTDGACGVFLGAEEVDVIPFAASSPFKRPHRLHGEDLHDKLFEVQRIKTSIWRLFLDSGYYAINQQWEVDATAALPQTFAELQKNKPGNAIPTRGGNAIRPLRGAGLSFDALSALEAVEVMAEQRSGVVRNAQGLNPDTLHDTAHGAQILISAAQKRVRQIARNLAEGIRDAYLLIHRFARAEGVHLTLRRRDEFVPVDASTWGVRQDATIKVGIGSGGREAKLAGLSQIVEYQKAAVEMQGGAEGPLVTMPNLFAAAEDFAKATGHDAERYFSDPAKAPPQEGEGGPSAEEQEAQAKMQLQAAQHQQDMAIAQQKADLEMQIERFKAESEADLAQQKAQAEVRLAEMKARMQALAPAVALPANRPGGSLAA